MASLTFDTGGRQGPARAVRTTPPELSLAVTRLAAALGLDEVAVVGPTPLQLDVPLRLTHADDASATGGRGLVVVSGGAGWDLATGARAVIAYGDDAREEPLDALARMEADAAAAGWRVAHASLVVATVAGARRQERPLVVAFRAEDDALARLLDNGPLSIALDPVALAARDVATQPARVLIASYEVTGPTGNGGIGTAYHSLAHALATAGHDVTLLFTGWMDPARARQEPEWRETFAAAGIDFSLLGTPWSPPVRSPHHAVRRAWELHRWLLEAHAREPFDVVHVPETLGHGYFAQTAKRLGLAYPEVDFVVGTHSSTRWVGESNRDGLESVDQLVTEHLERRSVAYADVLMSPSAYLLAYMRDRGWTLPERTFVQQYARPQSVRRLAEASASELAEGGAPPAGPTELVFFGRLETRKGLEAFCDAVDLLVAEEDACPFARVTLLGRPEQVMGVDAAAFVERRAAAWPLPWTILPDLGHDEAIAYLHERRCVVAIPSLVDNSPNTVSEAIALGVPFVASRSGGTAELIAPEHLAIASFDGWHASPALEPPTFDGVEAPFDAHALATALRAKAAAPSARVAPAVDAAACDRVYDEWHRAIAGRADVPAPAAPLGAAVCVVADDPADAARVAVRVQEGTRAPAAAVACCEQDGDAGPIPLVRAAGRDAASARNAAIQALDGDVVIVLRAREQPDATLVERVCDAMARGDADVLTLACRDADATRATGERERGDAPADLRVFVPVPGPAVAAIAYPALAVGPYAIRRSAFDRLGGYAADAWGEAIDHELLSRAALAGLRIDVLPEPVATTVRDDRWSDLRARHWGHAAVPAYRGEELIRLLRPFRRRLDAELADVPALFVGALRASGDLAGRIAEEADRRAELIEAYERNVTEQRELIALYEERQEAMRAELALGTGVTRKLQRLRRATRGPVRAWPGRGVRFARWRLQRLSRRT